MHTTQLSVTFLYTLYHLKIFKFVLKSLTNFRYISLVFCVTRICMFEEEMLFEVSLLHFPLFNLHSVGI